MKRSIALRLFAVVALMAQAWSVAGPCLCAAPAVEVTAEAANDAPSQDRGLAEASSGDGGCHDSDERVSVSAGAPCCCDASKSMDALRTAVVIVPLHPAIPTLTAPALFRGLVTSMHARAIEPGTLVRSAPPRPPLRV